MKFIRSVSTITLLAGIATLSFAGPSPRVWQSRPSASAATQTNAQKITDKNQPALPIPTNGCHGCISCTAKA